MTKSEPLKSEVDPFRRHFERMLAERDVEPLSTYATEKESITCPVLGAVTKFIPSTNSPSFPAEQFSLARFRPNLRRSIEAKSDLSELQQKLLHILTDYKDVLYSDFASSVSRKRYDEILYVYSAHALNHVLKSRHRILKNNTKLRSKEQGDGGEIFGDQGLTRPKVLILLPFRYMALNVVQAMIDLSFADKREKKGTIMNKKRFFNEYNAEEESEPQSTPNATGKRPRLERPVDYKETFRGNTDDCFRLGVSIGKGGSLKLYAEFYHSDIILASPLGLRMAIGAESEKEYDCDFLSSIEILILDRADVFLMQNWSHVLHIMDHLHKQPRESHGVDFSRVRLWNLNGWSKYYRQTVVLSPIITPELRTIFNGYCRNVEGRFFISNDKTSEQGGSLTRVVVAMPHAFQRFSCENVTDEPEKRYEFFIRKVLPQYTDSSMNGTLIYVPSYYDFVRLRNYCKKNNISCVQICEYTSDKKVSRARDLFFHGDKHALLYTERFHFYHRYRIKGIKNLIFYQLPTYPHFYSEMCNAMLVDWTAGTQKREQAALTCSVIFSQFDALRLAAVTGQEKAAEMLKSEKSVHMLITE